MDSPNLPPITGDGKNFVTVLRRYLSSLADTLTNTALPPENYNFQISALMVQEVYRWDGLKNHVDLAISWQSEGLPDYSHGNVYVKKSPATEYTYSGCSGNQYKLYDVEVGDNYSIKVVAVERRGVSADINAAPAVSHTVIGPQYAYPSTPTNFVVSFDRGVTWRWDACPDIDKVDYYELRIDTNPGVEVGLLERTRFNVSHVIPLVRAGTAYLYSRNFAGRYCQNPVSCVYLKPVPSVPTGVTITHVFQGFRVDFSAIPDNCTGANVYINGEAFFTANNVFMYNATSGNFNVQVCYTDIFGEGVKSDIQTTSIIEFIDKQMLANEAISLAKIDAVLQEAIARAQESVSTATYLQGIAGLQSQLDGQVMNWFYEYVPTLVNEPASLWVTDLEKDNHLGDLFYNTADGSSFRFAKIGDIYQWLAVNDTGVSVALESARRAQDTADSKRRIFLVQPVPPYDAGDLWTQGAGGDIKRCIVARIEGEAYRAADWEVAAKYTDDTALTNFVTTTYISNNNNMQSQLTANANGITSIVTELNKSPATCAYSAIQQTNTSITNIVTELNKPLNQCAYTALTQTNSAINLRAVKTDVDTALAGKTDKASIISQINISPEVITIDGKKVHITGETVFDDSIIVARMIGDQQVVGVKIKDGVISTDKITANAVTTAKLAANAVTADKIAAGVINANHIVSGSLPIGVLDSATRNYISAIDSTASAANTTANSMQNTVNLWKYPSSTYINGGQIFTGSITTNQLAAGLITADKIAANSVSADKISGGTLDLSKTVAITAPAGGLTIDSAGMKLTETSGAYTQFDADGIRWYSANGVPYAAIRRMVRGTAKNGQYVRINWDRNPIVLITPRVTQTSVDGYSNANLQFVCEAYNISNAGFRVRNETRILNATGTQSLGDYRIEQVGATFTFTTLSNITSASIQATAAMGYYALAWPVSRRLWLEVTYRAVGSTQWLFAGYFIIDSLIAAVTKEFIIDNLVTGQYEIKVFRYGLQKSFVTNPFTPEVPNNETFNPDQEKSAYCKLNSVRYTGGGVVSNQGIVDFIALDVDSTSYYTLE